MSDIKKPLAPYTNAIPILLAVDCIIFGFENDSLKLLVFKREVNPLAGQWSLIGSFVKPDEHVDEAANRVLSEITGLGNIYMEQLHTFGNVDRDNGGRVVSTVYWSFIKIPHKVNKNVKNHISEWVDIGEIPPLVLDHNHMVSMAIDRLRERAMHRPIGFDLLPEEFSIPQLLKVYEAIFQRKLDDRNFRKKILKSGLLTKTEKKDKSTSKKGSYLYRFNFETYKLLADKGYNFEF